MALSKRPLDRMLRSPVHRLRSVLGTPLAFVALAMAPGHASAIENVLVPLGEEQQVNLHTTGFQQRPAVAARPDGSYVVAWQGPIASERSWNDLAIAARLVAPDGTPVGSEFEVSSTEIGPWQGYPDVAAGVDGGFAVVWFDLPSSTRDARARVFDASGAAIGPDFAVNSSSHGIDGQPRVSTRENGDFLMTWTEADRNWIRLYRPDGTPASDPARLNPDLEPDYAYQIDTRILSGSDGGIDASWLGCEVGPPIVVCEGILRNFDSDLNPTGPAFVAAPWAGGFDQPQNTGLAAGPSGEIGLSWSAPGSDPWPGGAGARIFSASGESTGSFAVASSSPGSARPALAGVADGSFIVVWSQDPALDGSGLDRSDDGLRMRRFDQEGTPLLAEIEVHTYTSSRQADPVIASADGEHFLVAWESRGSYGDDDWGDSIQVRSLEFRKPPFVSDLQAALEGPTRPFRGDQSVTFRLRIENLASDPQLDLEGDELSLVLPDALVPLDGRASSGSLEIDAPSGTARWNGLVLAGGTVALELEATVGPGAVDGTVWVQGTLAFDGDGDGVNETLRATDDPRTTGDADPTPIRIAQGLIFADGFESRDVERWFPGARFGGNR